MPPGSRPEARSEGAPRRTGIASRGEAVPQQERTLRSLLPPHDRIGQARRRRTAAGEVSIRPDADSQPARHSYKQQLVNAPTDADASPVAPRFFSRKQARRTHIAVAVSILLCPALLARYCCAVNTHVLLYELLLTCDDVLTHVLLFVKKFEFRYYSIFCYYLTNNI